MRIIGILLVIVGFLMFLINAFSNPETSIHQIYERLGFVICTIEIVGGLIIYSAGCILEEVKKMHDKYKIPECNDK